MKKRIIAILVVLSILLSGLVFSISAKAITINGISVDTVYTNTINGADDKIWYTFTPSVSGVYAFVSLSPSNEAYLFTKKDKLYTQIAYAGALDTDYDSHIHEVDFLGKKYTHYEKTFYLEVYLTKGTTYYFAAGYANEKISNYSVNVILKNISIDESDQPIKEISVNCSAKLSAYNNGSWKTDKDGNRYFSYEISRIIQNMEITMRYKDGTSKTFDATDPAYDGIVSFTHNQEKQHWYPQSSDDYVKNTLTVSVGMISCDFDVPIEISALYGIKGKVVDFATNEPIEDATIIVDGNPLSEKTDNNGNFSFVHEAGNINIVVETNSSIDRSILYTVNAGNQSNNNMVNNPIKLINCDYVHDGIINAKDYAFAKKKGYAYHSSITNFTKNNY